MQGWIYVRGIYVQAIDVGVLSVIAPDKAGVGWERLSTSLESGELELIGTAPTPAKAAAL